MCSYEMMKSTWEQEPEKRPSFTDIVQFFDAQKIEGASIYDEIDSATDDDNNSGYIDIYKL